MSRKLPSDLSGCTCQRNERPVKADLSHPYDDPEFLRSLPDTHPAHPDSLQGKAVRKATEEEMREMQQYKEEYERGGRKGKAPEKRNWFQRKKDQAIGTKQERAIAREEKRKRKEEERQRIMVSAARTSGRSG